jgi:hypothetical protein
MSKRRLMYIELKSGYGDRGPAWISLVSFSKSGETVYFNGKAIKRSRQGHFSSNYFDIETGDDYWISGVKKRGSNRHWAGGGMIQVDSNALPEFLRHTGQRELDRTQYQICSDIQATDPQSFYHLENRRDDDDDDEAETDET